MGRLWSSVVEKYLLSIWLSFLETVIEFLREQGVSCYPLLRFDPLYNLHFEIYKFVKACTINYFSSDKVRAPEVQKGGKSFGPIRLWVHHGCNLLLNAIESDKKLLEACKDFLGAKHKLDRTVTLHGLGFLMC